MTIEQQKIPTKDDVKITPKDTIADGKITASYTTTWRNILAGKDEALAKFDEADKDKTVLKVEFETAVNGAEYIGHDVYTYFEKPSDHSNMGKALVKYGSLTAGTAVKVAFDGEGMPSLVIK